MGPTPRVIGWGLAGLAGLLALVVGLLQFERGPRPPFLDPGWSSPATGDEPRPADHDHVLALAGSGSNLEVTRQLARAFANRTGHLVLVHESIGSSGAVQAIDDGMIDIGLVSRPLRDEERDRGLRAFSYSREPVLVAVNATVPDRDITQQGLVDLFSGSRTHWSDGSAVVVLQREVGDSSHRAVDRVTPGFAEANERAWNEQRYPVLYHDAAMREAIASTVSAVGLHAGGVPSSNAPLRALTVGGVPATPRNVRDGSYPYWKDLAFVTHGEPSSTVRDFLTFVQSESGREIISAAGHVPLQPDGTPCP